MAKQNPEERWRRADEKMRDKLPPGVTLVRTLRGHTGWIGRIAWSSDGRMLASPSDDKTIRLWDAETGDCIRTLEGHTDIVGSAAFDPTGRTLASGSDDNSIKLWEAASGELLRTLEGHTDWVNCVAFDPTGRTLASASEDSTVKLWKTANGRLLRTFEEHKDAVNCVTFDKAGRNLATGSDDGSFTIWKAAGDAFHSTGNYQSDLIADLAFDTQGRKLATAGDDQSINIWEVHENHCSLIHTLEGHIDAVVSVSFSPNGELLASKGRAADSTIRLWNADTGACLATIPEAANIDWLSGLAWHPNGKLLAVVGSDPGTYAKDDYEDRSSGRGRVIHILELDLAVLFGRPAAPTITYASAKIVLVGDSGVGKTGLGWRLANGEFKEHASTHGQQFWVLNELSKQRRDGTRCEAVLWDLAGQPDYRLIHALFLDDADLALVLFDPTRNDDPLAGVEFWLKQLKVGTPATDKTPTLLIAARSDRGTPRLTHEELEAYCEQRGIAAYLTTSAKEGEGIDELFERMQELIPWEDKPATVTTETFKRIKDFVLNLKENPRLQKLVLTDEELRDRLKKSNRGWKFSDAEMLTSVRHIANHGYVTLLRTSRGEPRILLTPELLNNLAASFVLEARRNQKGLGSLEEQRLLTDGYKFPELKKLSDTERAILLDSATVLFLDHNVCFRETDPLQSRTYLVFPELINLKRPQEDDAKSLEEGVAYTVSGAVENVYASLVVLMGYTQTFTRTNQWRNHARYVVGNGQVCGFRLEEERAGELDFVLYFGSDTDATVRMLFQSLFENFLARRNLTMRRFEPVVCANGHPLNRAVYRQRMSTGAGFAFCADCGARIALPKADEPIRLNRQQAEEVQANDRAAEHRSRFEQVLFRLKTYATEQKSPAPECFISYAWGDPEHERWVEKSLATDLQKAGIPVVLDRWENNRIGASIPRFVERVDQSDRVIVVGTPLYRTKYDNGDPMRGFVAAAEGDLIGTRMIRTEAKKRSVLPVLLEGTEESAFPPLLHGRVYADFRKSEAYFDTALKLLMSLYEIKPQDPLAVDLRESLGGGKT